MNLTWLRDARIARKALFLSMSVWVSGKEISICIARLSKDNFIHTGRVIQAIQNKRAEEEQIHSLLEPTPSYLPTLGYLT